MRTVDPDDAPAGGLERPDPVDVEVVLPLLRAMVVTVILDDDTLLDVDEVAVQFDP
jgi:hypothetical protein